MKRCSLGKWKLKLWDSIPHLLKWLKCNDPLYIKKPGGGGGQGGEITQTMYAHLNKWTATTKKAFFNIGRPLTIRCKKIYIHILDILI
jgi:hypothetical protein